MSQSSAPKGQYWEMRQRIKQVAAKAILAAAKKSAAVKIVKPRKPKK